MKRIIALLLTVVMLASFFVGCTDNGSNDTTGSTSTQPQTNPSSKPTEPAVKDPWADYECITIAEALALCEGFVDAPSTDRYYIRATVKSIDNPTYGQMIIADETGEIKVYGSYNADGSVRYDAMEEKPVAGDEVLIHGTLQNYKGNTKEIQNARIIDFISNGTPSEPSELPADGTELTIAEILALPLTDTPTTQHYIVRATVESISNAQYGAMVISDGTGSISVYNSKNADGTVNYIDMTDKPYKGDSVVLKCTVHAFNGQAEIKQAYIMEFTHNEVTIDPSEYTEMTIADARNTAIGTKVKVSGVVARITYANGMIPAGIILVDETSSIYVYDGDLAARCKIGNTVSIYASKTYWIQAKEQENAAVFGYIGCNQLEKATVIEIDSSVSEFPKGWIENSTIKDILDTPVTTDISSKIFKVTAQIKEAPGSGFTNFYLNDLDGKTGSYVYSQCNGGDFEWLRQYEGKVCTVYMMALNAKATSSGCFWRFLPIAVIDEGFDPSTVNGAEHAVKYFGIGQFQTSYTGNPALELLASVNSELVGVTGATLSYVSSDPSVISIDGNVMNCNKTGTATITITGSYNGQTYSQDVTISVTIADQSQTYPTVLDSINTAVNETVTVKGIVGPSLVNRKGFYLIDKTGVIAVIVNDEAILGTLEIGQEIVIEGMRDKFHNGKGDHTGQAAITKATVLTNFYGEHDYPTESFKGEISVKDFYNLDIKVDYTTSVYTMKAYVVLVDGGRYKNLYLSNVPTYDDTNPDNVYVRLYSSSADQYKWLQAYNGQEITVEIAPCNWNNKNYYTGCVLSVINADGTKILNTLNFQ